jgi:thiamine biosynthesis protein ThiS
MFFRWIDRVAQSRFTQPMEIDAPMKITVNGETKEIPDGATVAALLDELGLNPQVTVVERNADILERAAYPDISLAEGDALELVRFVGGG